MHGDKTILLDERRMLDSNSVIAVIGLGYVGLPLAVEFGKQFRTIGIDLSSAKIQAYREGYDPTGEVSPEALTAAVKLQVSDDPTLLAEADYILVAVPTPVDEAHQPDFSPLIGASEIAGRNLKSGATIVYESTVYPGATEEICIPVLEKFSGKRWKKDFHIGYSPERINPGDKERTLTKIVKVVAGDSAETLERVADLYLAIIKAGVHRASSIKVAEAAKVIENTQRDLNVALMNELALIFDRMDIDTTEVLEAAGTKWNFLKFKPGLVGGHCIGVDPYYLTHKAEMLGYHPQVILAGRRINDGMGKFVAEKTVKLMIQAGRNIKGATVNVLGLTFKEDCPDLRNSRVPDIIEELASYGIKVNIHDPCADVADAYREYGYNLCGWDDLMPADALVIAVSHASYREFTQVEFMGKILPNGCLVDVKGTVGRQVLNILASAGVEYWRL